MGDYFVDDDPWCHRANRLFSCNAAPLGTIQVGNYPRFAASFNGRERKLQVGWQQHPINVEESYMLVCVFLRNTSSVLQSLSNRFMATPGTDGSQAKQSHRQPASGSAA